VSNVFWIIPYGYITIITKIYNIIWLYPKFRLSNLNHICICIFYFFRIMRFNFEFLSFHNLCSNRIITIILWSRVMSCHDRCAVVNHRYLYTGVGESPVAKFGYVFWVGEEYARWWHFCTWIYYLNIFFLCINMYNHFSIQSLQAYVMNLYNVIMHTYNNFYYKLKIT